jgi:hypothetical protein
LGSQMKPVNWINMHIAGVERGPWPATSVKWPDAHCIMHEYHYR